jgi:co-chaperonin GroES (HSP10)
MSQTESFLMPEVQTLADAFPDVDPGIIPLGGRVLVQLRRTAKKTQSGIVLVEETKDTVRWNNQVARVHSLGALAFRNRTTQEEWPEGAWVKAGDFIRVPRWNGDRIEVPVKGSEEPVTFVVFNDHELISKITGDPLAVKVYIL